MRQQKSLALLSALCSLSVAAAGSVPRGVGPEFAKHYGKEEFACIDAPNVKISSTRVNDNSCDCPDGSDEPGTAACAHIDPLSPEQPLAGSASGSTNTTNALPGFWCANKGHIGAYVPFVYVNDGICDYDLCCDGTEEFAGVGGTKCENKCKEIGKEYRRLAAEKKAKSERASTAKKALLVEAEKLRQRSEVKIGELQVEVGRLEAQLVLLEEAHSEAQKKDRFRTIKSGGVGGKLGVLLSQSKSRVNELRETLTSVADERDKVKTKLNELETILRKFKEEYNPNFNDEGVKAAVKGWEDYAARETGDQSFNADVDSVLQEDGPNSGINWAEFEADESDDTDIIYNFEAYLPPFVREFVRDSVTSLRLWLMENGVLADTASDGESQSAKSAREAKENAERDLQNKKNEIEDEKKDLTSDYGPKDIFRSIKAKAVEIDSGEYTYELKWLENTAQKSKKGHGTTNMGNFEKIDWETADDEERLDGKSLGKGKRMVMRYTNGQACWNGPNRRTDVWLGCAEKEEVWRVSEAEKCVYKMEVGTPAACDDVEEGHVKDEL